MAIDMHAANQHLCFTGTMQEDMEFTRNGPVCHKVFRVRHTGEESRRGIRKHVLEQEGEKRLG
ncbi:hypothetical protein HAX54_021158, partial [Datura stramonium]|nr:hypothetical protein [Datura stramonium]